MKYRTAVLYILVYTCVNNTDEQITFTDTIISPFPRFTHVLLSLVCLLFIVDALQSYYFGFTSFF